MPGLLLARQGDHILGQVGGRHLGNGHALFDIRHVDRSRMFQGQSAARDVAESELRTKLDAALGKERADLIMSFRGGDGFNLLGNCCSCVCAAL